MTRLPHHEIDQLADALETFAPDPSKVTFANYVVVCEPGRQLGVQRIGDCPRPGLTTCVSFGLVHEAWTHANFPDQPNHPLSQAGQRLVQCSMLNFRCARLAREHRPAILR